MDMKLLIFLIILVAANQLTAGERTEHQQLALDIFKELIETDTTHSTGDTGIAAQKMADRLLAARFPAEDVKVIINAPGKGNLVARFRSPAPVRKPVLLLAHLDVVEANPEDWGFDPFTFREEQGHFYGRGTLDDKDEAAIHIANFIWMKRQGYSPDRDIIVALTADEEGGPDNGVQYLLAEHRELVDAAFVINEGGGGSISEGRHVTNRVQTAEKVYQSYTLEVTNPGGHSSRPRTDNAIYQLAQALIRIENYRFPLGLNKTTRAMFRAAARTMTSDAAAMVPGLLQTPPIEKSVAFLERDHGALFRTTCVATEVEAGHAENALPQRAKATVNCRILPGIPPVEVFNTLVSIVLDEGVKITPIGEATASKPSPLKEEILAPIRQISESMWPGVVVLPSMSTGATDGLYFRNAGIPVYGVSGIFHVVGENRAHGRGERILQDSFFDGLEFLHRLTRAYSSPLDDAAQGLKF